MESLLGLTLFGSGLYFLLSVVLFLVLLIVSDVIEVGLLASFVTVVFLSVNYKAGNLPLSEILTVYNILLYIFIGFIFALVRTYFKGKELKEKQKEYFELKEHVFRWWFLFPISAINWIFGKLMKDLWNFTYNKFEKLFTKIFNL